MTYDHSADKTHLRVAHHNEVRPEDIIALVDLDRRQIVLRDRRQDVVVDREARILGQPRPQAHGLVENRHSNREALQSRASASPSP